MGNAGDSISDGCFGPAKQLAAAHNVQLTHNPTNAANVWWGAHCLDGWLRLNGRPTTNLWDIITFNFGAVVSPGLIHPSNE